MKIGILTAGGPAPGFNGVIEAVVRNAKNRGWDVIGIPRGYSRLISGQVQECRKLGLKEVHGIETTGGSILGTNRANPRGSEEKMAAVMRSISELGLDGLVTIGGDDTASAAMSVGEAIQAAGRPFRVAHVPKTIDNDLPLPGGAPTFGFETAKHLGGQLAKNLRVDAITTGRWYLVTAMGRSAGHLSLGIGMASGADLIVIREEFPETEPIRVHQLVSLVRDAIRIRKLEGQEGGLVVFAEGILERLDPKELAKIAHLELDEHGNPRMSEVDLGQAIATAAKDDGESVSFVTKLIGYELRCQDPVAFDVQYTRELGTAAVDFLAHGEGNGLVCIENGAYRVLRFEDLKDPVTNRVPVRRVDLQSASYLAARSLQARS